MALTDIGTSPYPVMKTMGMELLAFASSVCSWKPLKLGILTSSTRQLTTSGSLLASNSVAEPNILTLRPTELSRAATEIRKSGSSSTRKTTCCSAVAGIGDECIAAGQGRTPRSEAASSPLGEANIEALMVLSWRASIEEPPLELFFSNGYLRDVGYST